MNILNKLTIRHLKLNKKRTIVSIIGIILSTSLMVGIGLLFSTLRDNAVNETILRFGSYHSRISEVSGKDIDNLSKESGIKDYFLSEFISYATLKESQGEDSYVRVEAGDTNYFGEIELVKGRLPQNEHEIIVSHSYSNDPLFKLESELTISTGVFLIDGEESKTRCNECTREEEIFIEKDSKTYTVVGYYGNNPYVSWIDPSIITMIPKVSNDSNYDVYLRFDKMSKADEITSKLAGEFGEKEVKYNSSLLGLSGISKYDNIIQSSLKSMVILLSLVSVGCIIVIYNSFAISVLERKKQFGLFSSIGATKKQIQHTVIFEAIVVGTLGVALGILGAFLGIGVVLMIINHLLPNLLEGGPLRLCVYPIFLIVPVIFMAITILVSAFIPARRASRISPIEAIRLNDDIKMPRRKLKTPRIIHSVFKEEGVIAYKNMKRNKKKYRITIVSLFISIVLFLTFSSYMQLIFGGINDFVTNPSFDSTLNIAMTNLTEKEITNLRNEKGVKQSFYGIEYELIASGNLSDNFTKSYKERYQVDNHKYIVYLLEVPQKDFEIYKKDIGITEDIPLIYNNFNMIEYKENSRKSYTMKRFDAKEPISFELCETKYNEKESGGTDTTYSCEKEIKEYALLEHDFFGIEEYKNNADTLIIIPKGYLGDLKEFNNGINNTIYFDLDNSDDFKEKIDSYIEQGKIEEDAYSDIRENVRYTRNMIFVIKLLIYGFVGLVSLIGITSVFNTLYTSIHLRRREFAVLRSIGLTTGGFNRMLLFECFFFGMKSLLYSLPFSAVLILLLNRAMEDVTSFGETVWPVGSIIGVILAVFFIILITTMYATKKIKHENIMEAIREENI
ncbi:MAG: ABC transporter permease [Bacilli bacterium]|nr:ABC transporter permease [Bacilli bacterium]